MTTESTTRSQQQESNNKDSITNIYRMGDIINLKLLKNKKILKYTGGERKYKLEIADE